MGNVKASLKRKFGPLPVWAWALIAGAALYVYRTRRAIGSASNAASLDATSPDIQDMSGSRLDPVTLEPGQSAYDPNTGQLVSAAPEQMDTSGGAGGAGSDGSALDAGDNTADPAVWSEVNPAATARKIKAPHGHSKKTLTIRSKRHPKRKAQHDAHGKPVAKSHSGKGKPRTVGKILKKTARFKSGHGAPKARVRGAAASHPSGAPRARAASAPKVAIRQRPAAPQVTHPGTQRVSPHPATAQTHHAAPAAHPAPKRPTRRR